MLEIEPSPRTQRPTRFIIENDKNLECHNAERKTEYGIKEITVGRFYPEGSVRYYNLSNLSATSSVEIGIRNKSGIKNIELPIDMLRRIGDYHREDPANTETFDCASFVHYVNNIPYEYGQFRFGNWQASKIESIEGLNPGTTIMMLDYIDRMDIPGIRITHFGIYLADGLFISKFGKKGPLIVASFEEMKKGLGGENIIQLKPKKI